MSQTMNTPETINRHPGEAHIDSTGKLNWLRAGVLGANDGIVSVSCILLGIIAAQATTREILLVGVAAIISGAVSMALGEYVSVSAQRDSERHFIAQEAEELTTMPDEEHTELVGILMTYGISEPTAEEAASQIHAKDPLDAHLRLELGIDRTDLTNPWAAALSSAVAFSVGAALPLIAAVWSGENIVAVVTLLALALTGLISARLAGTSQRRAVMRLVIGGAAGLIITYGAGLLFGVAA